MSLDEIRKKQEAQSRRREKHKILAQSLMSFLEDDFLKIQALTTRLLEKSGITCTWSHLGGDQSLRRMLLSVPGASVNPVHVETYSSAQVLDEAEGPDFILQYSFPQFRRPARIADMHSISLDNISFPIRIASLSGKPASHVLWRGESDNQRVAREVVAFVSGESDGGDFTPRWRSKAEFQPSEPRRRTATQPKVTSKSLPAFAGCAAGIGFLLIAGPLLARVFQPIFPDVPWVIGVPLLLAFYGSAIGIGIAVTRSLRR